MIPMFKVLMSPEAFGSVRAVLESGYIGQGKQVDTFESELARMLSNPVLTTNSCTSALDLSLHLAGVGPGDEVVTTPMTCTATNSAIVNRKAIPVWADIDPLTGMISPSSVHSAISKKTRAIMVVNWTGLPIPTSILEVSDKIPIIEDAAHCFGPFPHVGDYICWSFQAIKFLTTGDGGALSTPTSQFDRARLLRWYGLDRRSSASFRCNQNIQESGYKYHMNDIAASIGLANLEQATLAIPKHIYNATYYSRVLADAGLNYVRLIPTDLVATSCNWIYVIHTPLRDAFIAFMADRGIEVSQVHARNDRHSAFSMARASRSGLRGLDEYSSTYIGIPVGWWLSRSDISHIIDTIISWDRSI